MRFTEVLKIVKIILNISIYKLKQEPSHEKTWENKNVFSFILKVDGFMLDRVSRGRLFHNFGAANLKTRAANIKTRAASIKTRSTRVFDDFIGGKRSKVPSRELRRL